MEEVSKPAILQIRWFDRGDGGDIFKTDGVSDLDESNFTNYLASINNLNFASDTHFDQLIFTAVLHETNDDDQDDLQDNLQLAKSYVYDGKYFEEWTVNRLQLKNPNKKLDWHLAGSFQSADYTHEDGYNQIFDAGLIAKRNSDVISIPKLHFKISYQNGEATIEEVTIDSEDDTWQQPNVIGTNKNLASLSLVGIYDQNDETIKEHDAQVVFLERCSEKEASEKKGAYFYKVVNGLYFDWNDAGDITEVTFYDYFRYTLEIADLKAFKDVIDQTVAKNFGGYDVPLSMPTFLDWYFDQKAAVGDDKQNKALKIYVRPKEVL